MALLLISGIRRMWVGVLCIVLEGDVELGLWCWGESGVEVLCRHVGLDGHCGFGRGLSGCLLTASSLSKTQNLAS